MLDDYINKNSSIVSKMITKIVVIFFFFFFHLEFYFQLNVNLSIKSLTKTYLVEKHEKKKKRAIQLNVRLDKQIRYPKVNI